MRVSASATYQSDTGAPDCLAIFAQGADATDLAKKTGMELLAPNWNGAPLYGMELDIKNAEKPLEQVASLLGMFDQLGAKPEWLLDFGPGMLNTSSVRNVYTTREELMEALGHGPS